MRIAIPTSRDRISPVFDVARRLLVLDAGDGEAQERREVLIEESEPVALAKQVVDLGADILICGAISRPIEAIISSGGVEVHPNRCGFVEEVAATFLSGRWTPESFLMPGCGRPSRTRRRHRRGQREGRGS
jgi:predicted Fe-Mo cluster-binding NifX family protein